MTAFTNTHNAPRCTISNHKTLWMWCAQPLVLALTTNCSKDSPGAGRVHMRSSQMTAAQIPLNALHFIDFQEWNIIMKMSYYRCIQMCFNLLRPTITTYRNCTDDQFKVPVKKADWSFFFPYMRFWLELGMLQAKARKQKPIIFRG